MQTRMPFAFLAGAALFAAATYALGPGARELAFPLLGAACVAAVVLAGRGRSSVVRRGWVALGVGFALFALGDLLHWTLAAESPSRPEALYLLAYPFLMAGFALLTHRPSLGVALDSAIVAAALFVVCWTAVGELAHDAGHWALFVASALPVLDLLLVVFVVRFLALGVLTRAAAFAAVGVAALVAGDLLYALHVLGAVGRDGAGLLWLAAYAFWGAAAVDRPTFAPRPLPLLRAGATLSRLTMLAAAVVVADVALAFGHDDRAARIALVLGVGGVALLALARTWELMRNNTRLLAAQRQAQQRFRDTLENVALVAVGLDARGIVTFANDFLLRLTGWERADVVGQPWFGRFDDDEDVRRDYFACMARNEIRPHFESTIRTRGGKLHTIRWSSTAQYDASGRIEGIITIGEDVTEQRRAEAELREREQHFRSLIENASDVVCVLSLDGVSLYESPAVERVLGWAPEELVGRRNFGLHHPDDAERVRAAFDRVLAGEEAPAQIECRLRHKDGSWRHVETIAQIRERGGERVLVLNYRDLTERRELEEKLRHAQKLEAVGRLAGGVAHDFNNLLTAIGGYAELLLAGLDPADPLRADAEEIARASSRAAALTGQLLAFSRRQVLRPEVLDAGEVVAELQNLLARLLGSAVELSTDAAPGCLVEADRGQLEQVITNLAVNARDAMPDGGRLSICTRVVPRDGEFVEIAVSDTGCGMDEHVLAHLFEPFFTTKEKGKGTGLGLSTVHGIVNQSGGDVLVWSEPGVGSTFRVLLPLAAAAPAPPPRPVPFEPGRGAETILLVEDEDMIRSLVRDVLVGRGYAVLDAPEAATALDVLRAHGGDVDLLLTDVVMPGLSGPALAQRVLEERPSTRVLFMSGYTSEPDAVVGATDAGFLAKPFAPQDLVAKVREMLEPVAA